jgi:hypothetical protein
LYEKVYPDVPIAWYVRSRKRVADGRAGGRAYLALEEEAEPILNDVIV